MAYPGPPGYSAGPSSGHTRVSYRRAPNFLERVGGSVVGSLVGCLVIVGACFLLFLNEGRSVHTYNMLVETRDLCNPLKSPDNVYSSLDNKLIYLSGKLSTDAPVEDELYGVSGRYVRLKRQVDMYQWVEETDTREYEEPNGAIRTERHYKYSTMWQSHVVDSNGFDDPRHHHNPRSMPVENMEWTAGRTSVGRYELSRDAVSAINTWHPLRLSSAAQYRKGMHVYGNELYYGDPHRPEVSVVGRQSPGPVVTTFTTDSGHRVLFLYMERLSMDELFDQEHASNQALTWGLRGLGWLLAIVGFNMVAGILTTLVDWIPLVRELVSLSVFLLSIALGSSLSLVVIAIAWLRYRPLYGLAILLISITPFIASHLFARKNSNKNY